MWRDALRQPIRIRLDFQPACLVFNGLPVAERHRSFPSFSQGTPRRIGMVETTGIQPTRRSMVQSARPAYFRLGLFAVAKHSH